MRTAPPAAPTADSLPLSPSDRSSARRSFHASSEDISSGDIYMFNSGFLHEVHPIIVREHTRMTISTFLGFSDEEVVVWG